MVLEPVAPSRVAQGLTLVLLAILVAIGVWGGQLFMEADYVVYGVAVSRFATFFCSGTHTVFDGV